MALEKLKKFINESIRVFKITKKPSAEEFKTTIKVTSIGTLIIGFLGAIIHIISQLIKR